MPKFIKNNVVDHKLLCNGIVVEDVTSVDLPTIEHPTTEFDASGMAAKIEMPDTTHLNAMEVTVNHNNGLNCNLLATPGNQKLEFRAARQSYSTGAAVVGHEGVKYRITGAHVSTEKGSIERGNPLGYKEKYAILRYEEEVNGEVTTLIDAAAGIIRINGVDYTSEVAKLLD